MGCGLDRKDHLIGIRMAKDSKPRVSGQGGMVPQKPKPPITGGNSQGGSGGSYNKGRPTKPTNGSSSTANKKPTP